MMPCQRHSLLQSLQFTINALQMPSTLCIVFQKDRIGACIWRDELESLDTCEFWDHGPLEPPSLSELYSTIENAVSLGGESYPATQTLLRQVRPSILIVSSVAPDSLISLLRSYVSAQNEGETQRTLTLDLLPHVLALLTG